MVDIDAKTMPCPTGACRSCPFEGEEPIQLSPDRLDRIYGLVATFQNSHICHGDRTHQTLCRGARNLQIKIAFVRGWINEPTDECFQEMLELSARFSQDSGIESDHRNGDTG